MFDDHAVIDFLQKMEITVMGPNHGGDPLGSIFGPMGSHWVKKMGQNRKKLPWPKIRIFDCPDFSQKMEVKVMAPNDGGDTLGAILGPMGSHWIKKWVKTVKNYHAQNSNFWRPHGHRFFPKNWSYGYRAKSRWGPRRVHLWANGVPLVPTNGSKP